MKSISIWNMMIKGVAVLMLLLVAASCGAASPTATPVPTQVPTATKAPPPTSTPVPTKAPAKAPQVLNKVFYADARTWPSQSELLRPMTRGKFYIPVQDENKIAVVDPDMPDYGLKFVEAKFVQPHHPWVAPGMRYVFINHQSEGKGDHNVMTVIDTFTDKVVAEIKTDFDDPFHCSFSPIEDLLLCSDLNPNGGYVYYIDPVNHTFVKKVKTNGSAARDVIQTHDGKYAFVGHQGKEGNLDVLDVAAAKIVKTIECPTCARLKMTPDGKYLLASAPGKDFTAIIDVQAQEIVKKIEFDKDSGPGNINYAMDGKVAMIGLGKAGKLALVDMEKLELITILDSGAGTNTAYANPVVSNLAIATNDQTDDWYTVVDVGTATVVERIEAGGKGTHNVHWSADGRYAVGSDRLGDTITVFRLNPETNKIEKVASVQVGFGSNGVQWVPYFCGVPYLTPENVKQAKNVPAINAQGECGAF